MAFALVNVDAHDITPRLFEFLEFGLEVVETREAVRFEILLEVLVAVAAAELAVAHHVLHELGQAPPVVDLTFVPTVLGRKLAT